MLYYHAACTAWRAPCVVYHVECTMQCVPRDDTMWCVLSSVYCVTCTTRRVLRDVYHAACTARPADDAVSGVAFVAGVRPGFVLTLNKPACIVIRHTRQALPAWPPPECH